jgi:hypothetical protein
MGVGLGAPGAGLQMDLDIMELGLVGLEKTKLNLAHFKKL